MEIEKVYFSEKYAKRYVYEHETGNAESRTACYDNNNHPPSNKNYFYLFYFTEAKK